jgi:hypothetical protein
MDRLQQSMLISYYATFVNLNLKNEASKKQTRERAIKAKKKYQKLTRTEKKKRPWIAIR